MATENNIIYKISVDAETATATIRRLNGTVVAGAIPVKELRKEFGNLATQVNATRFDNFNKGLKNATTNNEGLARASGGATTSVLELGRVVSDAPYGIRGMANNVSQLASNMLFTAQQIDKTTGKVIGLGGVLTQMGKTFIGPLGVLFAIQAVISALDYFYGGMKKAEDGSKDLRYSTVELESTMSKLYLTQDDVNKKIDEYIELIIKKKEVAKAEAEFQKELTDIDKDLAEARIRASKSVMSQKEKELSSPEAIANVKKANDAAIKEVNRLENERVRIIKESLAKQKEIRDAQKAFDAAEEGTVKALQDKKSELEKEQKALSDTSQKWKEYQKAIDSVQKSIEEITGKQKKDKKLKFILKDPKEFNEELKTLEGMALEYYQKSLGKQAENGLDKLKAEKSNEEDRLKALKESNEDRFEEQAEAAKKEYDTYLKIEVAKGNITEIERQKKQLAFNDSVNLDVANQKKAAEKSYTGAIKALNFLYDGLFKAEKKKQAGDKKRADLEIWKAKLDAMRDYAAKAKEILSSVASFIDGEFDRELATEKNKTNAINNELNQRLLNENLSKDERKSIQNQIAKNDELLRQKQEKVEKRRFEMNKAVNIAKAVVDTYSAAVAALKNNGGVPSGLPAMFGTIAVGLAQVATIARQKFVSSAGAGTPVRSGGGGSSSGGNDRSFNFNLVGNTQANQIAEAIQNQFSSPLKAYVVSRDVTTQQELDMNIKSGASF